MPFKKMMVLEAFPQSFYFKCVANTRELEKNVQVWKAYDWSFVL